MSGFEVSDPSFATRVRDSFDRQPAMALLGARLSRVEPGIAEIELPYRHELTQQHGFFHGGVTSTIADSAGGYAAYSLFPDDTSVLTVEYKINLMAPADGELLRAVGQVVRPGRTLTVCDLNVYVVKAGKEKLCAKGLQTIMRLDGRPDAVTNSKPG